MYDKVGWDLELLLVEKKSLPDSYFGGTSQKHLLIISPNHFIFSRHKYFTQLKYKLPNK